MRAPLLSAQRHPKATEFLHVFTGARSFTEIRHRIERLPTAKDKGAAFEVLTQALAATDPVLQIRRIWFPTSEAPPDVLARLGMPSQDKGCDGLAQDANGRLLAFQAKFHTDKERLATGADKIDSFRSSTELVDARYVYSTARHPDASQHAGGKPMLYVMDGDLADLPPERIAAAIAFIRGEAIPSPVRRTERDDQVQARQATIAEFAGADRATVVSACGTGKTLIGERVMEDMVAGGARNIMVFVPSIALVGQTAAQWSREWHAEGSPLADRVSFLAVCSDETAVRGVQDTAEMKAAEIGVPPTTDPAEIAAFLKGSNEPEAIRVIFSTYQSSDRIAAAVATLPGFRFDLGLLDEAHKTAVAKAGGSRDATRFTRPLSDDEVPIAKRLFMTATPRVRRNRRTSDADVQFYSMDNQAIYGRTVHEFTHADAVKAGVVTPFKLVVNIVRPSELGLVKGDPERSPAAATVEIEGREIPLQAAARRVALARAIQVTGAKRVLTFHERIEAAKDLVLPGDPRSITSLLARHGEGDWSAYHVNGRQSVADRNIALRELRQRDKTLVSNVNVLVEGVDAPAVDMAAFMSPKESVIDIVQAVGRSVRRADGKEVGYVVLPLLVSDRFGDDIEADLEQHAEESGFDTIVKVVGALADQDCNLAAALRELHAARMSGSEDSRKKARERLSRYLDVRAEAAGGVYVDVDRLYRAIETRILSKVLNSWEVGLEHLRAFVAEEGHTRVPEGFKTDDGFPLDNWIGSRRQEYRKGTLAPEKVRLLEAVEGWSWAPRADLFRSAMEHLHAFVGREQHAQVPRAYVTQDGFSLGVWVAERRREFSYGRLNAEKVRLLEEVSGWTWEVDADYFRTGMQHLQTFVAKEGNARVLAIFRTQGDYPLGLWVRRMRMEYAEETLDTAKIQALESLDGWSWGPKADQFKEAVRHLQAFAVREGHGRVPHDFITAEGFALGAWVNRRRYHYTRKAIPAEQIAQLEAVKGWSWNTYADQFDLGLNHLKEFLAREGHISMPAIYTTADGFALGAWVSARRHDFGKGKLTSERARMLESVEGWTWDVAAERFALGIEHLKSFVAREGHSNVPRKYRAHDGFTLGSWVSSRRQDYKSKILAADRIKLFEAIPNWVWDPIAEQFKLGMQHFSEFVAREGHARLPHAYKTTDGFALSSWVVRRRVDYRAGSLEPDRIRALEAIPGWSWVAPRKLQSTVSAGHPNLSWCAQEGKDPWLVHKVGLVGVKESGGRYVIKTSASDRIEGQGYLAPDYETGDIRIHAPDGELEYLVNDGGLFHRSEVAEEMEHGASQMLR
ncbi:Superfamily II DNA and RNA helicase [Roseomonas mucosa]|uniref:DEAD/DEAH box helicase n=1 Tax=Roseomonas mucosa TaxID=207340 RepID=UPI0024C899AA|nr:DEAD/DEAH box helicase [Roseomonas mucosa]QDD95132.1 Superfamily II DNA and RNA helicase [Roseomonas mucosa]